MILAPTNGPLGIQPHGQQARMLYKSATACVVGNVVCLQFTGNTYPPTNVAGMETSPFANCVLATGNTAAHNGPIGVVVDLLDGAGAQNTYITVQWGGAVRALVNAHTGEDAPKGTGLGITDAGGKFGTAGNCTSAFNAAITLDTITTAADTTAWVLLNPGYYFRQVIG